MQEISTIFSGKTGYKADFEFASSGSLAKKISAGAPCDLYISASREWMDYLAGKKLLDREKIKTIAETGLACVVPENSTMICSTPADLAQLGRIAVGDPFHVPAGKYAEQALSSLGLWDTLLHGDKLVLAASVRQVLFLAERGAVDAGIVYLGEARLSDRVEIPFIFPEDSHQAIEFSAAVVSASSGKPAAEAFLEFLSSEQAARVFNRRGFRAP